MSHEPGRTLKYIYNVFSNKEEVYDDTSDPQEQHNIVDTIDSTKLHELRQAILAFAPSNKS